ncbi:hypothetical protein [Ruegeria marina]|uniref:Uncharacterized protein n=1 Tax=Ruegeria marina TaxID=639004 RepID=A0A1G6LH80_9RHOB|nr:hypothetical protein [Ruegeria marina]SDC42772.1 hypothetical protein SAMN04488239_102246 [Ruegeria marina]
MNWSKGFFRVWLAISVVWIAVSLIVARPDQSFHYYSSFDEMADRLRQAPSDANGTVHFSAKRTLTQDETDELLNELESRSAAKRSELLSSLFAALVPPLVLLGFGVAVAWVLRGFKKSSS